MTDFSELKKLVAENVDGPWYVAGPQDSMWQVVCCETNNNEDDYALFECAEPNAALIVAAVNALPELIAMARENERLNDQRAAAAVRVALVSGDLDSYARGTLRAPSQEVAANMTRQLREALQLLSRTALKEKPQ